MKKLLSFCLVGCIIYCWGHWMGYNKALSYQEKIRQVQAQAQKIINMGRR